MNLKNLYLDDALFTFLDVETTGLSSKKDRICEIAMSGYKNFNKVYFFSSLVNPQIPIPPDIVKLNGIDDNLVADKPVFSSLIPAIVSRIEDSVLVGHNINFDVAFLENEFQRAGFNFPKLLTVDTWKMAVKMGKFRSNKLGDIAKRLGISCENWHRAASDIEMTRQIFEHFTVILKKDGISTVKELIKAAQ
ncbi:MAG: 3'-5' exonuclease [Elusimicrobiota bacterium]